MLINTALFDQSLPYEDLDGRMFPEYYAAYRVNVIKLDSKKNPTRDLFYSRPVAELLIRATPETNRCPLI